MRRTWIGAASAAALATAATTGFALAQQPRQEQAPQGQQMERGHNHRAEGARGAMEHRQSAQAQSPGEQRLRNEGSGQAGQERIKPSEHGKGAGGASRAGGEGQAAQSEKMNNEKRAGAENQGAKTTNRAAEQKTGQANPGENGNANQAGNEKGGTEEKGKTEAERQNTNEKSAGQAENGRNEMQNNRQGEAQSGRNETQNNRQGEGQNGQNAKAETHVNPQDVHAEGNAHLTNDRAARIADSLMTTARPRHVDVNVNVGQPLPGEVDLQPLPSTIVDLVPEYRGYDYVVANDEIVIVQPRTRHVVEVINTGGGVAVNEGGGEEAMAGTWLNPCRAP